MTNRVKKRRNITIIVICLIVSVASGIFSIKLKAISPAESDNSVSQGASSRNQTQDTHSPKHDSLKRNQQSRTFYNIPTKQKTPIIELNSADTLDLQALSGVGPAYAKWICDYRDKLGGFARIEQLKEVYKMTSELYQKLIPQVALDATTIRKIDINTASFKEILRHPYLDYYLTKKIIEHRTTEGLFKTLDDLKAIYLLDDITFEKVKPYLICTNPACAD